MNFKETKRYYNALAEIRVKCSCSHTMFFPAYGPDIKICSYCGHKVYRNDLVRFKDLLSKEVRICQKVLDI